MFSNIKGDGSIFNTGTNTKSLFNTQNNNDTNNNNTTTNNNNKSESKSIFDMGSNFDSKGLFNIQENNNNKGLFNTTNNNPFNSGSTPIFGQDKSEDKKPSLFGVDVGEKEKKSDYFSSGSSSLFCVKNNNERQDNKDNKVASGLFGTDKGDLFGSGAQILFGNKDNKESMFGNDKSNLGNLFGNDVNPEKNDESDDKKNNQKPSFLSDVFNKSNITKTNNDNKINNNPFKNVDNKVNINTLNNSNNPFRANNTDNNKSPEITKYFTLNSNNGNINEQKESNNFSLNNNIINNNYNINYNINNNAFLNIYNDREQQENLINKKKLPKTHKKKEIKSPDVPIPPVENLLKTGKDREFIDKINDFLYDFKSSLNENLDEISREKFREKIRIQEENFFGFLTHLNNSNELINITQGYVENEVKSLEEIIHKQQSLLKDLEEMGSLFDNSPAAKRKDLTKNDIENDSKNLAQEMNLTNEAIKETLSKMREEKFNKGIDENIIRLKNNDNCLDNGILGERIQKKYVNLYDEEVVGYVEELDRHFGELLKEFGGVEDDIDVID